MKKANNCRHNQVGKNLLQQEEEPATLSTANGPMVTEGGLGN